uniref:C2H2-type domain-containing protein n=1 Tax=Romanomermis culicivorax TaxID=13658 RepID=A0A915J3F5_ROMCU
MVLFVGHSKKPNNRNLKKTIHSRRNETSQQSKDQDSRRIELTVDDKQEENGNESIERHIKNLKTPLKEAVSYRCEEDFDAIDCSLRAQEWTYQLQSEHDYCPKITSSRISPPPKLQKECCYPDVNIELQVTSANIEIPSSDLKTVQQKNVCQQCTNEITNCFSNLSTIVDHQEIVSVRGSRATTSNAFFIPIYEPFTALALRYIDQMKVERTDYYPNCKICDKVFSNSTNLLVHYRSHAVSGIKPFSCKLCSASFTRRQSLQYHEMCHNDQSLYTCSKCQATFRHRSHYKDHLRKHSNDSAFCCEYCPQSFGSRSTLRRHIIKFHEPNLY